MVAGAACDQDRPGDCPADGVSSRTRAYRDGIEVDAQGELCVSWRRRAKVTCARSSIDCADVALRRVCDGLMVRFRSAADPQLARNAAPTADCLRLIAQHTQGDYTGFVASRLCVPRARESRAVMRASERRRLVDSVAPPARTSGRVRHSLVRNPASCLPGGSRQTTRPRTSGSAGCRRGLRRARRRR